MPEPFEVDDPFPFPPFPDIVALALHIIWQGDVFGFTFPIYLIINIICLQNNGENKFRFCWIKLFKFRPKFH